MTSGRVALLRRRGRFQLGLVRLGADGRLWVLGDEGLHFRVNEKQIAWETGIALDDAAFPGWLDRCLQEVRGLDLREAWQVVQGEVPWLSLADLADLLWGPERDDVRTAAALLGLHTAPLPYFTLRGQEIVPRTPGEIEEQLRRQEQERHIAVEEEAFLSWLGGGSEPAPWTQRHQEWLEAVRHYAVHGESSHAARVAHRLLRRVHPTTPDLQRLAFEVLAQGGVFHQDEPLELHRLGVSAPFPPAVIEEAARLAARAPSGGDGRLDLTGVEALTVDEASTADMDDALSIQAVEGGWVVGIHITDVAAIVPPDSLTDREAGRRVSSLYLPEGAIPMLPPSLSLGAGSLLPEVTRPCISLLVRFDADLRLAGYSVAPSVVRTRARLSYEEADRALEEQDHPLGPSLRSLQRVAGPLRAERLAAGALEMNRPEVKVAVDASGQVEVSVVRAPTPARRLVAEFMVLANRLMGEFCRENAIPAVYRTQDPVSMEDIDDTTVAPVWQYQVLRRIRPAAMTVTPGPHALLGVPVYLQATSPLRRYLDLVVQRQVVHFLGHGAPLLSQEEVSERVYEAEGHARALARAEDDRKRYWILKDMSARTGETFSAVVLEARERLAVVELVSCMLRSTPYLGPGVTAGQTVQLRLQEVDLWRRQARLVHEAGLAPRP